MKILDVQGSAGLTPTQSEMDSLVSSFTEEATNWRSLVSFTAGGMAGRAARLGIVSRLSSPVSRFFSLGAGLGTEASVFEVSHRLLSEKKSPEVWYWGGENGLGQGILKSLIAFGTLKAAGVFSQGENAVVRHVFQMGALVLGNNVFSHFGIGEKPTGSLAEQLFHAEAINLQMIGGMGLLGAIFPRWRSMEGGMDLLLRAQRFHSSGFLKLKIPLLMSQEILEGVVPEKKSETVSPNWSMSENKTEKGSSSPLEAEIDEGWDEAPLPSTKEIEDEGDRKTPPWTPSDASALMKQALPSNRPQDSATHRHPTDRPAGSLVLRGTDHIFREFLLTPKDQMQEVEEAIQDYLTYCRGEKEGEAERYAGIAEARQLLGAVESKEQYQYLYIYTKLTEGLNPGSVNFWEEMSFLGTTLEEVPLPADIHQVLVTTFLNFSEAVMKSRPGMSHEMGPTFNVVRNLYLNESLHRLLRERAMLIYAEYRSLGDSQ